MLFLQSQEFFGADSQMHAYIMEYLDRQRWQVHVALGGRDDEEHEGSAAGRIRRIDDITVRPTDFGPQRAQLAAKSLGFRMLAFLRSALDLGRLAVYIWRRDIAIVHGSEKPRDALATVVLTAITPARGVIHLHGKYGDWMHREVRWAFRRADAVAAVSDFTRSSAIELGGIRPERCHVLRNAVDPGDWDPDFDPAVVRREFGIGDNEVLLGIFARMSVWKGHLDLARALARLPRDGPDYRVLVVGEDDPRSAPGHPPLSETLRAVLDELGIADRFIFTGWRWDIQELMAAVDVYTMPAFEEGLGLVFLEAMAMSTPVVALASGGVPEVVEDEVTGLLAPVGDIEGLKDRLERLMRDPALRRRMGEAGRKRVVQFHAAPGLAQAADRLYSRLLARTRRQGGRDRSAVR